VVLFFCWLRLFWPVGGFGAGWPFPAWLGAGVMSVIAVLVAVWGGVSKSPCTAGSGIGVIMVML